MTEWEAVEGKVRDVTVQERQERGRVGRIF